MPITRDGWMTRHRFQSGSAVVYFVSASAKCEEPVATDGWVSKVDIRNRL